MAKPAGKPETSGPADRRATIDGSVDADSIGGSVLDNLSLPIHPTSNPMAAMIDPKDTPAPETGKEAAPASDQPITQEPKVGLEQRYENLEKRFGQQGTELGELRKLTDRLLFQPQQPQGQPQPQQPEIPPMTDEALEQELIDHPAQVVRNIEQRAVDTVLQTLNQQTGHQRLVEAHSDFQDVTRSPEFHAWAKANVPQSQIDAANVDPDGTSFLISQFKARAVTPPDNGGAPAPVQTPPDRNAIAEEIATKRHMVSQAAGVGTDKQDAGLPEFTRIELIQLRLDDPAKYEAMQPQIIRAYRDNRVK